ANRGWSSDVCSSDLERDGQSEPGGEQFAETIAHPDPGAQAPVHEEYVHHEDRHEPGEPELLTEGGEDEVGVGVGNEEGIPVTQAGSEQPAGGEPEQPVDELVGAAGGTGVSVLAHRVEPDIEPRGDVAEAVDGDEHPD